MTRYVVVVKPPDDHPGAVRVFGTFTRDKAVEFELKIRDAVDKAQEAQDPGGYDDVSGYAYFMPIDKPSIRQAKAWALRGERS